MIDYRDDDDDDDVAKMKATTKMKNNCLLLLLLFPFVVVRYSHPSKKLLAPRQTRADLDRNPVDTQDTSQPSRQIQLP
jgi:hypothetical protein